MAGTRPAAHSTNEDDDHEDDGDDDDDNEDDGIREDADVNKDDDCDGDDSDDEETEETLQVEAMFINHEKNFFWMTDQEKAIHNLWHGGTLFKKAV
ncbi:hypothetical protein U0070_011018 [Myodes glareolus]|uniref:Uncharacterized protein n=1 Tax=Myodes glareolus TaxID=447135 RepID=A0AAW0IIB6_MYOGA